MGGMVRSEAYGTKLETGEVLWAIVLATTKWLKVSITKHLSDMTILANYITAPP